MSKNASLIKGSSLLAILAVALLAAATAHADTPLRWKFEANDNLNYVLNRSVEGKLNLTGSEILFKMGMAFDVTWKVKSVAADGTAQVDLTVDRMQINMSSPLGGDLVYDSQNPGEMAGPVWSQMSPMVEGMLGQDFQLKISPLGKVSDIEVPAKLAEVFKKQTQGGNRQSGFGIGGGAFSERGIKELIEKSVLPLPEAAAAKDVTWKQHFENAMRGMGSQMTDTTFSFAGPEKLDGQSVEKISAVTELTFEAAESPMADVEITAQEGSATFYFDPQAGRLVEGKGTQTFVMEITGAREITQDMKETMTMRLGKSPAGKPPAEAEKEATAPAKN
jgi:hypothetical protein